MRFILLIITALLASMQVVADTITHSGTSVNVDFVNIGNAGNAADSTGYGAVNHDYRIGKYEVTASQWDTVVAAAGIDEYRTWSGSQPVGTVSWLQAVQFCNWLTSGNKYTGAYQFDGNGVLTGVNRGAAGIYGTVYVLPTEDEWYKAAYYTGSGYSLYANGTDTAPVAGTDALYDNAALSPWIVGSGTMEQNGTFDMMGNVWEMLESTYDGTLDDLYEPRTARGASYSSAERKLTVRWEVDYLESATDYIGFRVAAVPEPMSALLIAICAGAAMWIRGRFVD